MMNHKYLANQGSSLSSLSANATSSLGKLSCNFCNLCLAPASHRMILHSPSLQPTLKSVSHPGNFSPLPVQRHETVTDNFSKVVSAIPV